MRGELVMKDEVYAIVGAAMEVHKVLKGGFLEEVYHEAMCVELSKRDIPFETEKELDIYYKEVKLHKKYFADLVCFDDIIVELKATTELSLEHEAQLINYLNATKKRVGILINFRGPTLVWKRFVL